jgi:hypothetical protein
VRQYAQRRVSPQRQPKRQHQFAHATLPWHKIWRNRGEPDWGNCPHLGIDQDARRPRGRHPYEDAIISIGPPVAMIIFGVVDAALSAVQELPRGTNDVDTAMSCLPYLWRH